MSIKIFLNKLHYERSPSIQERIIISLLTPLSWGYMVVTEGRNFMYRQKILKCYKPKAMTISIGNITTGGTGKTPVTGAIANYFLKLGKRVAILSRGYGSKLNPKEINIISNGAEIFYEGQIGGDEPVWLAENCKFGDRGAIVLTSSNREQIARYAENELGAEVLIIDDGFQHQKLGRDVNILLVDSKKMFGNSCVLPKGALREGLKNINRADKIIVVDKGSETFLSESVNTLEKLSRKPVFVCRMLTEGVYNLADKSELKKGEKVLAFSAIAQPEQFFNYLKEDYEVLKTVNYPDHYGYSEADIEILSREVEKVGATSFITTEKDGVKLKHYGLKNLYILRLKPSLDIEGILA